MKNLQKDYTSRVKTSEDRNSELEEELHNNL